MDEDDRNRAREPQDALAIARAAANLARMNQSESAYLRKFIGMWCYEETYKMNYRGVLVDVIVNGLGDVVSTLWHPLFRTGEWGDQPDPTYEERMATTEELPGRLAWDGTCNHQLQPKHWPKSGPEEGPRARG